MQKTNSKITKDSKTWMALSWIIFLISMVLNYGPMVGLFGRPQEEISDMYRNFITPPGYIFSIWGIIYGLLLAFLIYQVYLLKKDKFNKEYFDSLNKLFIAITFFNILWNITWVNNLIAISTILIFIMAILLGLANKHILLNKTYGLNWIIPAAFAIYFGWIVLATVTNVAAFLVKINWNMFGLHEHIWACLMYIVTAILAGIIIFKIKNPLFNLPIIWGFIGIFTNLINKPHAPIQWAMPYVVIGVILALIIEGLSVFLINRK